MSSTAKRPWYLRWRQFSLRTLLILVTISSLPMAGFVWLRSAAQRQARAVAALRQTGASVRYEFEAPPAPPAGVRAPARVAPPAPIKAARQETALQRWARRNLGSDFAHRVESLQLGTAQRPAHPDSWPDFFRHARELRGVRDLELHGATIDKHDFQRLPFLESLTLLAIDKAAVSDEALLPLSRARRLETLQISNTPIGDAVLEAVDAPELEVLALRGTKITDRSLAHLAAMPKLKRLSLSSADITAGGFAQMGPKPELTHLEIVSAPVGDDALAMVGTCTKLEELLLVATEITGGKLDRLAPLTRLKRLNLAGSPLNDAGLAKLPLLPSCTYLDLSFTDITDAGIQRAQLPPNLRQIVLNGTFVRDQTLAKLEAMPQLAAVEVRFTDVTPMGVQHFQAARPQCAVFN